LVAGCLTGFYRDKKVVGVFGVFVRASILMQLPIRRVVLKETDDTVDIRIFRALHL
jgi:hypothetical protein